ncbi:hypothetical protein NE237_019491 [Protea cynaroides]|uniref:Uncharacterized protein n=1 Tax=Protea cynaroides TaxID=273540 RepID=A0A9Q0GK28_9MAGN|nr:hypothetical protein NE237_019491 [Protea cynaroides]
MKFIVKFSAVIISVNYRFMLEHRFPSQYNNGIDTLKFLDQTEFNKFGFPRLQISPGASSPATAPWMWKVCLLEGENRDHEALNVSGPKAIDTSGVKYPVTMVAVGGFDRCRINRGISTSG